VIHVHLKDVSTDVLAGMQDGTFGGFDDAIRARLFTELGAGVLDLDGVLDALIERGYAGWLMVEQDSCWGPPSESAAIGRRVLGVALRRLGRRSHGPPGDAPGTSSKSESAMASGEAAR
jgi:sugar phosphate isomerase/epimerase